MACVPFRLGSPIIVAGPTNSGKTVWVKQLITTPGMFDQPVASILYCYGVYQELFKSMKESAIAPIHFLEGLPAAKDFERLNDGGNHIIILDDLMQRISESKDMANLFSRYCHHKRWTTIMITQNIFHSGRHGRTISLNTHIFVLFANKRDVQQIHRIARQFYPINWRAMVEVYKDVTDQRPYSYLVCDVTPAHPSILQLRTDIFPPSPSIVYVIGNVIQPLKQQQEQLEQRVQQRPADGHKE